MQNIDDFLKPYEILVFDNNGDCDYYDDIKEFYITPLEIKIHNESGYSYEIWLENVKKIYIRKVDNTLYGNGTLNGSEVLIYGKV